MDMQEVLIGNTLEETAYHEAGHIVVASVKGLALRPMGIMIWEAAEDVTEGIACYCEDEPEWEKILLALRAGEMAQVRQFPNSSTIGSLPDIQAFARIIEVHFENRFREMQQKVNSEVNGLLDIHWDAIVAISQGLVHADWIPVVPSEHSKAKRKKHLDGDTLLAILGKHGISAHVRGPTMTGPT